jgi:hypothetical protein
MASPTSPLNSPLTKTEAVPPIPTPTYPTYPTNGLFTILTTTTIDAPIQDVLDASLDFESWSKWNSFVPLATIISQRSPSNKLEVGAILTFHSCMKRDGPISGSYSNHEIVSIEKTEREGKHGWSIVWKTVGIPGGEWVLGAERVQEFTEVDLEYGREGTEYKTWGTFGGPMAYMLSWTETKDDIVERFGDWANGLKTFVEDWK